MRWDVVLAALVALAAGASGCSSSTAASVQGKVTYGGEPIDVGTITFIPETPAAIKTGGIIDSGAYNVEAKVGPPPGKHRVEIRWAKPTGRKSKNEFGEDIQMRQE